MQHVSIKDIAKAAKVSHPTVSRALGYSPLVKGETAKRIRQIAASLGYRPSAIARSLATKRTKTIGVVVTSIADPFIADVIVALKRQRMITVIQYFSRTPMPIQIVKYKLSTLFMSVAWTAFSLLHHASEPSMYRS